MTEDEGRIISIIPAPEGIWLPAANTSPPHHTSDGSYGYMLWHHRVAVLALVERPSIIHEGRMFQTLDAFNIAGEELDNINDDPNTSCDNLANPLDWTCDGHWTPVAKPVEPNNVSRA